jgi:Putative prokaryotic signal transducing protein
MDVSIQELTEQFRKFNDEELLLHVRTGTLTPLATALATAELRSRGIEPQPAPQATDEPADGAEETELVTVAGFWDPLQANVLRARLESEGISAFVWSEPVGIPDVNGGSTRVQVKSDDVEQAREVMASIERGELAIPDSPDTRTSVADPLKSARRAARGGAVPFAILAIGFFRSSASFTDAVAERGGTPVNAAVGAAVFALIASGLLYLTWRTYRKPTLVLCFLATVLAAWDFVSAFWTHGLSAIQLTEIVSALIALYSVSVMKSSEISDALSEPETGHASTQRLERP